MVSFHLANPHELMLGMGRYQWNSQLNFNVNYVGGAKCSWCFSMSIFSSQAIVNQGRERNDFIPFVLIHYVSFLNILVSQSMLIHDKT
jgi:hypothetical protein